MISRLRLFSLSPLVFLTTLALSPQAFGADPLAGCVGWTQLHPSTPPTARGFHCWAADPVGGNIYLFGGTNGTTVFGDLWYFNLATNQWSQLTPPAPTPPPRLASSMVYDQSRDLVVIYGGVDAGNNVLQDFWTYSVSGNSWTQLSPSGDTPGPLEAEAMVYDARDDGYLLFGGGPTAGQELFPSDNLWLYLPSVGVWQNFLTGQGAVWAPNSFGLFGAWRGQTQSFLVGCGGGGILHPAELRDIYSWSTPTNTWAQIADLNTNAIRPEYKPGRLFSGAAYSPLEDAMYMYGGYHTWGPPPNSDLNTGFWSYYFGPNLLHQEVESPGPGPRFALTMADDDARARLVLFGGETKTTYLGDTWQFCLPPTFTPSPTPSPTKTPTDTPTGTPTPTPTLTPTKTATKTPTLTPTHTPTTNPTTSPTPTDTFTPTQIPTPTPTSTSTKLPTATPSPTSTPTPTSSPSPSPSETPTCGPVTCSDPPCAKLSDSSCFTIRVQDVYSFAASDLNVTLNNVQPPERSVTWITQGYDLQVVYCLEDLFPQGDYTVHLHFSRPCDPVDKTCTVSVFPKPGPTLTPTPVPPPAVYAGGYLNTWLTVGESGLLSLWAMSPAASTVDVAYQGNPVGVTLAPQGGGIFAYNLLINGTASPVQLPLQFQTSGAGGGTGITWPALVVGP